MFRICKPQSNSLILKIIVLLELSVKIEDKTKLKNSECTSSGIGFNGPQGIDQVQLGEALSLLPPESIPFFSIWTSTSINLLRSTTDQILLDNKQYKKASIRRLINIQSARLDNYDINLFGPAETGLTLDADHNILCKGRVSYPQIIDRQQLCRLEIYSLRYILTPYVAKIVVNLQELILTCCQRVEEVINMEDEEDGSKIEMMDKVNSLRGVSPDMSQSMGKDRTCRFLIPNGKFPTIDSLDDDSELELDDTDYF
ncbi:hypothetical protein LguiB_005452 [Lonicera macranthoides]